MTQFKQEVFHYQQQRHFVQINCTTLDEQDSLLKRCDMPWHNLALAWNHAEDMIPVSPLTANVFIPIMRLWEIGSV